MCNKEILVMGGTSFVSKILAKKLISKGYVVDILTRGRKNVDYEGYREHIICDRKDMEQLEISLMGKCYDIVFDINAYFGKDVEKLLNAIDKKLINKYILCSTCSVYEFKDKVIDLNSARVAKDSEDRYARNKRNAEDVLMSSGVPYIIIRPTYVYGEYNEIPRESYIFEAIKEGDILEICRNKKTEINLIYVEELAEIFISAMNSSINNKCYIASNSEKINFEQYIKYCEEIIGKKANIVYYNENEDIKKVSFPYLERTLIMNNDQLGIDRLYVPHIPLKDGLIKTYKWMVSC